MHILLVYSRMCTCVNAGLASSIVLCVVCALDGNDLELEFSYHGH